MNYNTNTHVLRLPGWAGTREVKPIWILLKHKTVSGSGISWAICKSAPHSRQITTPSGEACEACDINKQTTYIVPKSQIESRVHYASEPAWGVHNWSWVQLVCCERALRLAASEWNWNLSWWVSWTTPEQCREFPSQSPVSSPAHASCQPSTHHVLPCHSTSCLLAATTKSHTHHHKADNGVRSKLKVQDSRTFQGPKLHFSSTKIIDKKQHPRRGHSKFRLQCDTEVHCTVLTNTVMIKASDRLPSSICL